MTIPSDNKADKNGRDGIAADTGLRNLTRPPAPPNFVPVPGGAQNNKIANNKGSGNTRWDGSDVNPNCDNNAWIGNLFTVVSQPCVSGH